MCSSDLLSPSALAWRVTVFKCEAPGLGSAPGAVQQAWLHRNAKLAGVVQAWQVRVDDALLCVVVQRKNTDEAKRNEAKLVSQVGQEWKAWSDKCTRDLATFPEVKSKQSYSSAVNRVAQSATFNLFGNTRVCAPRESVYLPCVSSGVLYSPRRALDTQTVLPLVHEADVASLSDEFWAPCATAKALLK